MKILRGPLGLILALVLLIAAGAAAGYALNGRATASSQDQNDLAAEGKYQAYTIGMCAFCHTPPVADSGMPDWSRLFAGGRRFEGWWGASYSANITSDPKTGIGAWTDKQIAEVIRNGRNPDGDVLILPHPWQLYHAMAESDVQAIIAYLRTVRAISNQVPQNELALPMAEFVRLAGEPALSLGPVQAPRDGLERGRYLANVTAGCSFCHSPHGLDPSAYLGGGFVLTGPDGKPLYTRNITPDPETGIGDWTDEQIATALRAGLRPDGRRLSMVMPNYSGMTDADMQALIAYLRTVPPVRSAVPENQ